MSRVGKAIIKIPPKVEVKDNGNSILVKGPLGNSLLQFLMEFH
jgi:ribosomal protein L6P/L9E